MQWWCHTARSCNRSVVGLGPGSGITARYSSTSAPSLDRVKEVLEYSNRNTSLDSFDPTGRLRNRRL